MPAFKVSRTTQINADPDTVFNTLSDYSTWESWSPWLLADKNATVTLRGDPGKVGGGFSWDSSIVGAGEMEHVEIVPPSENRSIGKMLAQLRFTRPWKSESNVNIEVKPAPGADDCPVTDVRWEMEGSLPFFMFWMKKMMTSLVSMDYDRGLRMAKELIETSAVASDTVVHGITEVQPRKILGLSGRTTLNEIGVAMDKTVGDVMKQISAAGLSPDVEWLTLYDQMNLATQTLDYTCGFPTPSGLSAPNGLEARSIPGFSALHVTHTGRYEHLGNAWFAAYQHLRAMKRKPSSKLPGLERYANSPEDTPADELVTELFVPVK